MIGKAPATGSGFKGLVNYLVLGKLAEESPDRVAWSDVRNLAVDDPRLVPRIMRCTANQSTRCPKPVYHLVVSWHKDENPSEALMRQVGDTTLADLDLLDHQTLLVAHHDTQHRHLHIVVNRVHPETGKAWDRWQDWPRIEQSLARQAKALGFRYVPGRHNQPEAFRDKAKRPRNGEYRMAERLGTTEQLRGRWTKEQIAAKRAALSETFERCRSWSELTRALAAQGLTLERKGQGIVIGDATGTMKLSDLRRDIRLRSLEDRYGETWPAFEKRRDEPDIAPPVQGSDDEAVAAPPPVAAAPKKLPVVGDHAHAPTVEQATADAEDETAQTTSAPAHPGKLMPAIGRPDASSPTTRARPPESEEAAASAEPTLQPADDGAATGHRSTEQQPEPVAKPDRSAFVAKWKAKVAAVEAEQARAAQQRRDQQPKPAIVQVTSPGPEAAPKPDRSAFVAKWKKRVADIEAARTEEARKKAFDAKAKDEDKARKKDEQALNRAPKGAAPSAPATPSPAPPPPPHTSPSRQPPPSGAHAPDPKTEARIAAYDAKGKADAAADLAHTLHGAGLVTRKQLARAVRERETAQAEVDKTIPGHKKLERELRKVLTPDTHKPAKTTGRQLPANHKGGKEEPER